jgi:anti-sigma B factor antagonist
MAAKARMRVDRGDGHILARVLDRDLFDDRTVRDVSDQLLRLTEELEPGSSLILDFSEVQTASSTLLGRLILVHRRLEAARSRLVLCELNENVAAVLRSSSLDRFFHIFHDRKEALERGLSARRA